MYTDLYLDNALGQKRNYLNVKQFNTLLLLLLQKKVRNGEGTYVKTTEISTKVQNTYYTGRQGNKLLRKECSTDEIRTVG